MSKVFVIEREIDVNLAIFGATGSVGQRLVEQALEQKHRVTAFGRNPDKLELKHDQLKLMQGDVLNYAAVEKAVKGQDAVLCALGAGRNGSLRSEGTKNIVRAMEANGVKRFICQTTLGVGDSAATLNFYWKYIMFGLLLRDAFADHGRQEEIIKASPLDWTIVRPGAFTNGERTGNYQHFEGAKKVSLKVSRADVADFMLKQLSSSTYLHKAPGLSY